MNRKVGILVAILTIALSLGYFTVSKASNIIDKPMRVLKGHEQSIGAVAFSNDGLKLFTGSKDKTIGVWDISSGQLTNTLTDHTGEVTAIAVSPDNELLASGSDDGTVRLWSTESNKLMNTLSHMPKTKDRGEVMSLDFSVKGNFLASAGAGIVVIWNPHNGKEIKRLNGSMARFLPDGKHIVVVSKSQFISFYDTDTWSIKQTIEDTNVIKDIKVSSDGSGAIIVFLKKKANGKAGLYGGIEMINLSSYKIVHEYSDKNLMLSVTGEFSPDGNFFALCTVRGVFLIEFAAGGVPTYVLTETPNALISDMSWSMAFNNNSDLLAVGYDSGKVSIWGVPKPDKNQKAAKQIVSGNVLPAFNTELKGNNVVRIRNPNDFKVSVGLRSASSGKDFVVAEHGIASSFVPDGPYEIFFVYSNKPEALFKGDDFTLKGNGIEIQIIKVVGGNYGIKQVK